jgi:hypothetical protein
VANVLAADEFHGGVRLAFQSALQLLGVLALLADVNCGHEFTSRTPSPDLRLA